MIQSKERPHRWAQSFQRMVGRFQRMGFWGKKGAKY